jgi:alcohol dehydrogenase (cytochrome c)
MNWYHQYTPGDMWDYDEEGSSILIDVTVDGQPRKVATHAARNGFIYTFERTNGQTLMAKPHVSAVNWTKGIDQKTGKPIDYDPNRDVQVYSGQQRNVPAGCAHPWAAATISSRRPTAKKPGCFTSHRCRTAMSQRSIRRR